MKAFLQFFLVMLLGVVLLPPPMQASDSLESEPTFHYQQQPVQVQLDDFQRAGQPMPQFGQYSTVPGTIPYAASVGNNALEYGIVGMVVITLLSVVGMVIHADIKARNTLMKDNTTAINNNSKSMLKVSNTLESLEKSMIQRFEGFDRRLIGFDNKLEGIEDKLRRDRP